MALYDIRARYISKGLSLFVARGLSKGLFLDPARCGTMVHSKRTAR